MSQQHLDLVLISYLARNDADGNRRHGIELFQDLSEEHRGGITTRLWQTRYTRRSQYFDAKVDEKLRNETAAQRTTPRQRRVREADLPVNQEDERRLVEYLAENSDHWNVRRSLRGKLHYRKVAANEDRKTPWGVKHSPEKWRRHFHENWDRLFQLVLERRKQTRIQQVGPYMKKWSPEEDELLVSYLAEKKAEGANLCGQTIYRELVENKDGKWPWAALRTQVAWKTRYAQTARELLEPMVEARHAELLASSSLSSLSKPTTTTKLHPNLPANAHVSGRCAPERVGPKSRAKLRTPTASASSSKLVDVRTEDLLTAATNDIPRHGLFSPQDDAVLLQYLIRRNGGSTIDCHGTRKSGMTTFTSSLEVDMFNHLIDTVPDARKHTAQTWRKHYQRLKSHFDRLVDHFGRTFTPNEVEMVDDEQEECRPRKRRKLDGPGDSVGEDDEPELGAWTNECPETTFHLETSDEYIAVGDLDPKDEDLVEELEVERSLYHDDAHSGIFGASCSLFLAP